MFFVANLSEQVDLFLDTAVFDVEQSLPEDLSDVPTNPDWSISEDFLDTRYDQQKVQLQQTITNKKEEIKLQVEAEIKNFLHQKIENIFGKPWASTWSSVSIWETVE